MIVHARNSIDPYLYRMCIIQGKHSTRCAPRALAANIWLMNVWISKRSCHFHFIMYENMSTQSTTTYNNKGANLSEVISKNELCKLYTRICLRSCRKLCYDCIVGVTSPVLRTCPIQSLIKSWLRWWGIIKGCMLQNENWHYFGC